MYQIIFDSFIWNDAAEMCRKISPRSHLVIYETAQEATDVGNYLSTITQRNSLYVLEEFISQCPCCCNRMEKIMRFVLILSNDEVKEQMHNFIFALNPK